MQIRAGSRCVAKIDRVVFGSSAELSGALDNLPGFDTECDHALKTVGMGQFSVPYGRVRRMTNQATATQLFVNYRPRFRRFNSVRVAIVPADGPGLLRDELEAILAAFAPYRLLVVEMALDFSRGRQ